MTISTGDKLPDATFKQMTADGPQETTTQDYFGGRKVALFAVPGAFTPTCHNTHVPGFLNNADAFKAKGVDAVACVSVNDRPGTRCLGPGPWHKVTALRHAGG
jgi:peroxiredoxin